jgi:hypothetical protein
MFKILGPDGKELGPINADTLRQWVGEGKVDLTTLVRREDVTEWTPLAQIPEVTGPRPNPSATSPPPLPPPPLVPLSRAGAPPSDRPRVRQRTSGLAIAAFVLSFLASCTVGLSAIASLVVGFMALRQIKRSGGELRGKGLAIIGQALSVLSLLAFLLLLAIAGPEISRRHQKQASDACVDNLEKVARAIQLNAEQNHGKFPSANDWCDVILPQLGSASLLQCPRRSESRSGYAYNRSIAGRTTSSVPPETVLLFESARGWNATISQDEPLAPSVHGGSYVVAFANGRVREVKEGELSTLRWEP